ncbi:hypothetical protein GCM10025867_30370 [Frondihabitans sucicola]|uniref:Uncharacterized protein n=1 Tax=Frondihabitans sucicola TaxID=1268041 RepID=A0ABM8GQQ8_9MICO|nr:hypothetical protein GCM10025867_30370 [Frondihabitans sucicola]
MWDATWAKEIQVLRPVMLQPLDVLTARVCADARSDPASGSVKAIDSAFPARREDTIVARWVASPKRK